MRNADHGVAGHLRMTPRQFVESLRKPSLTFEPPGTDFDTARLEEIDGWLWAEARWPTWGEGGKAFVLRAKAAVQAHEFIAWLDSLPPMKEPPFVPKSRRPEKERRT